MHQSTGRAAGSKVAVAPAGLPRPYPIEWICLAAGLGLVLHYAWLLDDAYVYFRYVDNLLFLGNGLVFNRGEYVEGVSSPLWTLLLSFLRLSELNYWILVRGVAVSSFLALWFLMVRVNRAMAPDDVPVINFPLVFLTFNYATSSYFTSGTESPLTQLVAAASALLILRPSSKSLQVAVALSPLVRHELAVPFLAIAAWVALRERRIPWTMLLVCALTSGAWLVFRVYYYADLFPNTFYLKNVTDLPQGLLYLHDTLRPYHIYEIGVIAVVAAITLGGRRDLLCGRERLVMAAVAVLSVVFVVKIGGDAHAL